MTWVLQLPAEHKCDTPESTEAAVGIGSLWRCEECQQVWTLIDCVESSRVEYGNGTIALSYSLYFAEVK